MPATSIAAQNAPAWAPHGYGFSVEHEGRYAVFTDGTIVRLARSVDSALRRCTTVFWEMILKPFACNKGYLGVSIVDSKGARRIPVHRLVCSAFYGHVLGLFVNHKNGNKRDNRALNLEWITPHGNVAHAISTGLRRVGQDCPLSKLDIIQVREIRSRLAAGEMPTAISKDYPTVTSSAIASIFKGKTWRRSI